MEVYVGKFFSFEFEDLLAHVEIGFDAAECYCELRTAIGNLVKLELPVDLFCDLWHNKYIVKSSQCGNYVLKVEAIVQTVFAVVVLLQHPQEHLGNSAGRGFELFIVVDFVLALLLVGLLYMAVNYRKGYSVSVHRLSHVHLRMIVLNDFAPLKYPLNFPLLIWEQN